MQPPQLVFDPENTVVSRPYQRIKNSYRNTVIPEKSDIALFSDSIPRGMNIKEIYRQIQGVGIQVEAFPGAKTQLNHYVTPTLEEYSYDAAIIHVGINGILRFKYSDELDKLPGNIIKAGNT